MLGVECEVPRVVEGLSGGGGGGGGDEDEEVVAGGGDDTSPRMSWRLL